jgi:hypothetical protein
MNLVRRKALLYLRPPHADGADGHDRLPWCGHVAAAKRAQGPPSRRFLSLGRRRPFGSRKPGVAISGKSRVTTRCQGMLPRLVRIESLRIRAPALTPTSCPLPSLPLVVCQPAFQRISTQAYFGVRRRLMRVPVTSSRNFGEFLRRNPSLVAAAHNYFYASLDGN